MKKQEKAFAIATYNIQATDHPQEIVENIRKMRKAGVSLFCLQEVRKLPAQEFVGKLIEKSLGEHFQAEYFLDNFGLAIFWDTRLFSFKSVKKLSLPQVERKFWHERVVEILTRHTGETPNRKALVCTFSLFGKLFRVSNVHLDWQQGHEQRAIQLKALLDHFRSEPAMVYECICGDFNTIHVLKQNREQFRLDEVFAHEYKDITRNVVWTYDWYMADYVKPVAYIMRKFRIHYYQKLDYIWVKNLLATKVYSLPISGSDHLPVVAELEVMV